MRLRKNIKKSAKNLGDLLVTSFQQVCGLNMAMITAKLNQMEHDLLPPMMLDEIGDIVLQNQSKRIS